MSQDMINAIKEEGYSSYWDGVGINQNPFISDISEARIAWNAGWTKAEGQDI